jgi:tetratricopeptide (TPR) repeat protein
MIKEIFFSITLVGCSLAQNNAVKKHDDFSEDLEQEFSFVTDKSFRPIPIVKYENKNDVFTDSSSDDDVLSKESLDKSPAPRVEDVVDSDDQISALISQCYKQNFTAAFRLVDKLYSQYKKNVGYWNQIGTCYLLKGEVSKSILFYNKARSLKSNFAPAINNLGVINQLRGKFQKSLLAYKEAASYSPKSLTPKFNLAQLYLKFGHNKQALNIFKHLNDIGQDDPDILNGLAVTYLKMGKINKSIEYFKDIDSDLLESEHFGINYAYALNLNGKKEKARKIMTIINKNISSKNSEYFSKVFERVRSK